MPSKSPVTYQLDCFNNHLGDLVKDYLFSQDLIETKDIPNYLFIFIDPHQPLLHLTQKITDYYIKAKESNLTKICLIILNNFQINTDITQKIQNLLNQLGNNSPIHRLIVTQDIFTEKTTAPISEFEQLLRHSISSKSLQISSKGNNFYYPTPIDNLLLLILKSVFLYQTAGKTYYYVGGKITDLNLSYLLKSTFENVNETFDINASGFNLEPPIPQIEKLATETVLDLNQLDIQDQDVHRLLSSRLKQFVSVEETKINKPTKINKEAPESSDIPKYYKSKILKFIPATIITICVLIIAPVIIASSTLFLSYKSSIDAISLLKAGELSSMVGELDQANKYFSLSMPFYQLVSQEVGWLFPKTFRSLDNFTSFIKSTQSIIDSSSKIYVLSEQTFNSLNSNTDSTNPSDGVLAIKSNLVNLNDNLSQIKLLLNKSNLPFNLKEKMVSRQLPDQVQLLQEQSSQAIAIIDYFYPIFQSNNQPINVLLVIQDPTKLKPSGGEYSSFISIDIANQKITNINTHSPQELNDQLSGKIDQPGYLSKITGRDSLSLIDTNYDPDLGQTTNKLHWFLSKINFPTPNLTIFVTDNISENYLSDPENLVNQYKNKQLSFLPFVRNLLTSYKNGDIQAYYTDPKLQITISNNQLSGLIKPVPCHPQIPLQTQCLSETIYANESNYTAHPINSVLDRSQTHTVSLKETYIEHIFNFSYHYLQDIPNLNRPYQALYQFYLPKNSTLSSINLDSQPATAILEEKNTFGEFDHYTLYLPTPLNQDHKLVFQFQTKYPDGQTIQPGFAYSLNTLKQPGTNEPYQLTITYPNTLTLKAMTSKANASNGQIIFSPDTFVGGTFGVQF